MACSARFAFGWSRCRQLVQDVGDPMDPAGLGLRLGPDVPGRRPEAERAVGDRHDRGPHPPPLQVAQHRQPALGALPIPILDGDHLLRAVRPRPDHDQGAQPVVFEADVEVDPVRPDVDVVPVRQVAPPERGVLRLPDLHQPRDRRRRQPGRVLPEQPGQRRLEVPGRQPVQVQQRQHLGHLRRPPHVRRQDPTPERLLLAVDHPPVVHPRRPHLQGAGPHRHLPGLPVAVPHHLGVPALVARLPEPRQVVGHLGLERRHQHPPRPLPRQLVQARPDDGRGRRRLSLLSGILCMGSVSFLAPRGRSRSLQPEGYAAFFMLPVHNLRVYLRRNAAPDERRHCRSMVLHAGEVGT